MAYSSSDVQEVVTSIDIGRNNELRVSTIKAKDSTELKSMDIRQWWLADDGEMRPGKGVRIKSEHLAEVIASLINNCGADVLSDLSTDFNIELPIDEKED